MREEENKMFEIPLYENKNEFLKKNIVDYLVVEKVEIYKLDYAKTYTDENNIHILMVPVLGKLVKLFSKIEELKEYYDKEGWIHNKVCAYSGKLKKYKNKFGVDDNPTLYLRAFLDENYPLIMYSPIVCYVGEDNFYTSPREYVGYYDAEEVFYNYMLKAITETK